MALKTSVPAPLVVLEVDINGVCHQAAMLSAYAAAKSPAGRGVEGADETMPAQAYAVDRQVLEMYAGEVLGEVAAELACAVESVGKRTLTLRAGRRLRPGCRHEANRALHSVVLHGVLARWYGMSRDARADDHRRSAAQAMDDLRIALWRRTGLRR